LKFFVEDAKIQKIFWQFEKLEGTTRKRTSALFEEGDLPKRLRTKMEQIDLSSDSSSMELSDYDDEKESVTSTMEEATTSTQIQSEPNVKIISVDIIKEAENPIIEREDITEVTEEVTSELPVVIDEEEVIEGNNEQSQLETTENAQQQRRPSDTNKIVISDSSEDEDDTSRNNNNTNNRRFSDGNYSTSYSFAEASNGGGGGRRFESHSASFDDDFRRYNHNRRRREHFNEEARRTYRNCNENMQRMFQQAQSARDQAFRNFRNSAGLIPDLLSTFQSHFRPLFQQHQQPPPPPRFNQHFQRF
jgi:hypothetical protein